MIANALDSLEADSGLHGFGVANVEEGVELRRNRIKRRIYVLSGIQRPDEELYRCLKTCNLLPVISSLHVLEGFAHLSADFREPLAFHLKLNTGMNRLGVDPEQLPAVIALLKRHPRLALEGLLSHYAAAESPRSPLTRKQTELFRGAVAFFRENLGNIRYVHMENSFGLQNHLFPEANLVRVGLHLYGEGSRAVSPIARWTAQVYDIREVAKGEGIGYGPMYRAKRRSRIAILGVGYGDGYPRALSNRGEVLIHGKRCKVVGAVSMDLTAVDVTDVKGITADSQAVLLGKDRNERITAVELAKRAACIPWEILTGISARVPRTFKA